MSNIFKRVRQDVVDAIEQCVAEGTLPRGLVATAGITAEPPREAGHGDVATNAAMVLARPAGMKPRDIATVLGEALAARPGIRGVDIAGPGFLNLRLHDRVWCEELRALLAAGTGYGDTDLGGGRVVNVEYVSANPTGPMHVGHCRGAVFGDALAALLEKAGYAVTREYYINDAGAQVDVVARSAYLRYREALGETIGQIPEGLYPGDYLKDVGAALARDHGRRWLDSPEKEWLEPVRDFAVGAMLGLIREDLAALGVRHAVFASERALVEAGQVAAACAALDAEGHLYTGTLDPPKGMLPDDWEPRPQLLFRATAFGDDIDRPLKKSDGSWTYFASDIAYHRDKFRRGAALMIDVWGADHGGYVKRMQAAVTAVTGGVGRLDVRLCQLVRVMRQGEPVRMSKRAGTFVTLREVVDEVGKDVVRFIMLTRKNDAPLDFDLARVMEQSRENPVFYVQYAHARVRSALRQASEAFPGLDLGVAALAAGPLELLVDPDELALIRRLADWPRVVEGAAEAHEPHRLAFYLYDLAAAFHALWTKGREQASLRFIREDAPALTRARLAMVRAVGFVVASGLGVFGVTPVEEMR